MGQSPEQVSQAAQQRDLRVALSFWGSAFRQFRRSVALGACLTLFPATPSLAHHSEPGFDPAESAVFEGRITDIFWGNPHILFTVDDGTTAMRVEWVTVAGAEKTDVSIEQFSVGERLIVIGSRAQNPTRAVMTYIKELQLPDSDWLWISPSVRGRRP